jgi:hypothetical protein
MELKDYLATRMMWDPSQDDETVISQFLELYYGGAAPHVRLYMDTMHASIAQTGYYMSHSFRLDGPDGPPAFLVRFLSPLHPFIFDLRRIALAHNRTVLSSVISQYFASCLSHGRFYIDMCCRHRMRC